MTAYKPKPMSGHFRPTRIDPNRIIELAEDGNSQNAIARQLKCTQPYVSKILKSVGMTGGKQVGSNPNAIASADEVIEYILTNGGTLKEAMEKLNLPVHPETVRRRAAKLEINIFSYRYMHMSSGIWQVTKPGFKAHTPAYGTYLIPVTCTNCGHETEITHQQLVRYTPIDCIECGH